MQGGERCHHTHPRGEVAEFSRPSHLCRRFLSFNAYEGSLGNLVFFIAGFHFQRYVVVAGLGVIYGRVLVGRGLRRTAGECPFPRLWGAGGEVGKLYLLACLHGNLVDGGHAAHRESVHIEVAEVSANVEAIVGSRTIGEAQLHRLAGKFGQVGIYLAPCATLVGNTRALPEVCLSGEVVGRSADCQRGIFVPH